MHHQNYLSTKTIAFRNRFKLMLNFQIDLSHENKAIV